MAINYDPTNWVEGKEFNPDNCNHWEQGIKSACDGVDALESVPSDLARNGYGETRGGYNLVKHPYNYDNVHTANGMTFTVQSDGSVIANGTTTAAAIFSLVDSRNNSNDYYPRLKKDVAYTISLPDTLPNGCSIRLRTYNSNKTLLSEQVATSSKSLTLTDDFTYYSFYIQVITGVTLSSYAFKPMLEEGTTAHAYEPYFESNKMLTEDTAEIASLKYLGWTVPRGYNGSRGYQDAKGAYHQRGYRVDLGSLNWVYESGGKYFQATNLSPEANTAWFSSGKPTAYAAGFSNQYSWGDIASDNTNGNNAIAAYSNQVLVHHGSYTDPTAFRSAMSGVYLYYELATEVVIAEGNEISGKSEIIELGNGTRAIKAGNVVTISIYDFNGLVNVSGVTLGYLPASLKPSVNLVGAVICGPAQNIIGYASIDASVGQVVAISQTETYYVRGTITYVTR